MPARPKQRHIDCFIAIVRQGSIARASELLSLTQPAVSRTLADLEQILGARLMERSRTGITLTAAGETFLRYAAASSSALDEGISQIAQSRRDQAHAVNIGVLPNLAAGLMPKAVLRFKEAHGAVPVRIFTGTNTSLMQSLREGNLDLVVGRLPAPGDMSGLTFTALFQEELSVIVRPGHALCVEDDPGRIGEMIAACTVLIPVSGTIIRESAEQLLISLSGGLAPNIIEVVSVEFGRAYVEASQAVWIVPLGAIEHDLEEGRLIRLPLDTAATRGTVGITQRKGLRLSPLARELAEHITFISSEK